MKGVIITTANQSALASQYHILKDDYDDLLPLGYILIADFGQGWIQGTITQQQFDELYTKGQDLKNDYFVVVPK